MFNVTYRKILTNIFSILFLFNFLLADPSEMPVNTISLMIMEMYGIMLILILLDFNFLLMGLQYLVHQR